MHNHQSETENVDQPVWREFLQILPIIGPIFDSQHQTKAAVVDAVLEQSFEFAGQAVGMYTIPNFIWPSISMNKNDMDMHMHKMDNMPHTSMHDMKHKMLDIEIKNGVSMATNMLLGGAAGKIIYAGLSKYITQDSLENGNQRTSYTDWFKQKMLGSLPLFGPFFTAKTKLKAVGYSISHLMMIVNGTVAVMLLPDDIAMDTEAKNVAITLAVMTAGMTASQAVEIPLKRSFAFLATKFGLWHEQPSTTGYSPLIINDDEHPEPSTSTISYGAV